MTASGQVFQSHPQGVYYEDTASGKTALIAPLKDSAGALVPPNSVVYSDAFEGLKADVLYVYAKNGFEQTIVFKQVLPPPVDFGMDPATTRVQIRTVFDRLPQQHREQRVILKPAADQRSPELADTMLFFDDLWFPVGVAFTPRQSASNDNEPARLRLPDLSDPANLPIAKTLAQIDNATVLIESVDYADLAPRLKALAIVEPKASGSSKKIASRENTRFNAKATSKRRNQPLMVASEPYKPLGVAWDYYTTLTGGTQSSYIFASGSTYVISNSVSFASTTTATFQAGTCVKYAPNTYMQISGQVSFPSTGTPPVFTSTDDNAFGATINNSTGNPSASAAQELMFYFDNYSTTVQNARFRWASQAFQYGGDSSQQTLTYYLNTTKIEHCTTGVYQNQYATTTISFTSTTSCDTPTPLTSVHGSQSGGISVDCGVVNASQTSGGQFEPAIAVNPANSSQVAIVAMNGLSGALLQMVSSDGGATWSHSAMSTITTPVGDADPSLAFDDWGNLFLAYRSTSSIALYVSTDLGSTWNTVPGFSANGASGATPQVRTGPILGTAPNQKSSVWVTLDKGTSGLLCIGTEVTGLGTSHISSTWPTPTTALPNSTGLMSTILSSLAIGPGGQALVAHIIGSGTPPAQRTGAPVTIYLNIDSDGLGTSSGFVSNSTITITNLGWQNITAVGSGGDIAPIPNLAWDRSSANRVYICYPDGGSTVSTDNNTDIIVRSSSDNGASWSSAHNVIDTTEAVRTSASQFHPRIAVDPTTGNVAVYWYDCRRDSNNALTHVYATVSKDHFTTWSRNFRLNPGQSNESAYEVYKDYIGLTFYGGYFYPAWSDNSDGATNPNIYTAKVMPY